MKDELLDQTLHAIMWSPLLLIGFFPDAIWAYTVNGFWAAFWREDSYHRLGQDDGWGWILKKDGKLDIAVATVGATLLGLIPFFVLR